MSRPSEGVMLVISGPSGSGKSTICKRLLEDERVEFSVSVTTRPRRPGEVDGRDYLFVSVEEFVERRKRGEFIESAEVHGNLYGTLWAPMEAALRRGKVYLVEIDVQGALQLKTQGVRGIYVFIAPPDFDTLRRRLEERGTDSQEVITRRLEKARDECLEQEKYDHVVVNRDLAESVRDVRRIAGLAEPSRAEERR